MIALDPKARIEAPDRACKPGGAKQGHDHANIEDLEKLSRSRTAALFAVASRCSTRGRTLRAPASRGGSEPNPRASAPLQPAISVAVGLVLGLEGFDQLHHQRAGRGRHAELAAFGDHA